MAVKTLNLTESELNAVQELKREVSKRHPCAEFILFGSRARGDFHEDSDIDILILLEEPIVTKIRDEIIDIAYEIEFKYVFSFKFGLMIENKDYWNSRIGKIEPIHQNIDEEGIAV